MEKKKPKVQFAPERLDSAEPTKLSVSSSPTVVWGAKSERPDATKLSVSSSPAEVGVVRPINDQEEEGHGSVKPKIRRNFSHAADIVAKPMGKKIKSRVIRLIKTTNVPSTASVRERRQQQLGELLKSRKNPFSSKSAYEASRRTVGGEDEDENDSLEQMLPEQDEDHENSFFTIRYYHHLSSKNRKTAETMLQQVEYFDQLNSVKWVARVFVEEGEAVLVEDDATFKSELQEYTEKWAITDKGYENVASETDDLIPISEMQDSVTAAVNEDFKRLPHKDNIRMKNRRDLIHSVTFSRMDSGNGEVVHTVSPFSTSAFCAKSFKAFVKIRMAANVKMLNMENKKYLTFEMVFDPERKIIRVKHTMKLHVAVRNVRKGSPDHKILNINIGYDCVKSNASFAQNIDKLKQIHESKVKYRSYIKEHPDTCANLFSLRREMSHFLTQIDPQKKNCALGAIGVELLKDEKINSENFKANYAKGTKLLRYFVFDEENEKHIKKILWYMSKSKFSLRSRVDHIEHRKLPIPYTYSREVTQDTPIDFFISHSWSDNAETKFEVLSKISKMFKEKTGRLPRLWMDVFCINQHQDEEQIAECVKLLPLFLMSCDKVIVLLSESVLKRLWCLTEILARHILGEKKNPGEEEEDKVDILVHRVGEMTDERVNLKEAQCFHKNDEIALRKILSNIPGLTGEEEVENLIQEALATDITGEDSLP